MITAGHMLIQRKYYLWPIPYSNLARDILQLLTLEKKAPGHGLREQFYAEHPQLVGKPDKPLSRIVYLFVDSNCDHAELVSQLTKHVSRDVELTEMKLAILASTLSLNESIYGIYSNNIT